MPVAAPTTTLTAIQTKVRRLTRSPSQAQLSDTDLQNYINTFVVYDFPEHLRLFNLRTTFTFVCNPFQDRYPTDEISFAGVTTNPLYDFKNRYISIADPIYIAGYQSFFTQSREQMFAIYPNTNSIQSIGTTGDGVTQQFTGTVTAVVQSNNSPQSQQAVLLQGQVLFSSVDASYSGLSLVDVPVISAITGNPTGFGNLYVPGNEPTTPPTSVLLANNINYVTGQYTITFPTPPAAGVPINSQTVPAVPALPQALLYYDDVFTLRPVPDQPYRINIEAYVRPTYLMETTSSPLLNEWWQYIAYGAAKKIFEDRMDTESVAQIMPEFKKQEALCLRRTIVQYTNDRVATIYTEQTSFGPGSGAWGWGGGNF
jgi:hypothetical protein